MIKKWFLYFCVIFFPIISASQTVVDLEKQRAKTEQDLQATSQLLAKTSKQREESMQHVNVLQRQLTLRKKLISEIDNQILLFESDIESKTDLISSYKTDLTKRKHEYAKLIRFAYRNKSDMDLLDRKSVV